MYLNLFNIELFNIIISLVSEEGGEDQEERSETEEDWVVAEVLVAFPDFGFNSVHSHAVVSAAVEAGWSVSGGAAASSETVTSWGAGDGVFHAASNGWSAIEFSASASITWSISADVALKGNSLGDKESAESGCDHEGTFHLFVWNIYYYNWRFNWF